MTAFGVELAWLALRVTLVATVALGLAAWSGRRQARSGVILLAGTMAVLLLLALAAWIPLPDAWSWSHSDATRLSNSSKSSNEPTETSLVHAEADSNGVSLLSKAFDWLRRTKIGQQSASPATRWLWSAIAGIYLLGLSIGTLRLFIGSRQLRTLQRRSRPISDPDLLALVDVLSAKLGCVRSADLCEVDDFGPAATLGWRRPVILLGTEWRGWTADELRAVLAHELAHVRHRDFLIGLVTGVCRALYFYHPLVRWLAAKTRWHQEVAADDAAANVVGDRPSYLKALARLALRLPARMPVGAPLVMPAMTGGILLRRIDMLRRTEQRPMNTMTRGLLLAVLGGVALLVSTWRGSAQTPGSQAAANQVEPFEIGYVSADAKGIVALRPSVWIAQPGLDKVTKKIDELLQEAKTMGFELPDIIRPENIEQIVTNLHLATDGTGKPGSRSVQFGTSAGFIRFHKDVDVPGLLKPFFPDMKEIRKGDVTLYHLGIQPILGPTPITLFQPDRRSVVLVSGKDEDAAELALQRVAQVRKRAWGSGWKDVQHAAFAAVIDNSDGGHSKTHQKDLDAHPDLKAIVDNLRFATFAIELGEGRPMRMVIDAKSADGMKQMETGLIKIAEDGLAEAKAEVNATDKADQVWLKLATDMVQRRQVRITGARLEWLVYSPIRLRDLVGPDGLPIGTAGERQP